MAPWESPVRRRLRESLPVFGCTITTSSLDVAARAATAGFHFLWLELEHAPLTLETVRNIIFVGTGDLSFSLGLRGQQDHPRVEAAALEILAAARRHGKVAGRPAGSSDQTKRYVEQGLLFFQAPSDLVMFEAGARQFLAPHGIHPARRPRAPY
jgi:2-keto-3-deoxy-L-rhamnonate aldolase RhmA